MSLPKLLLSILLGFSFIIPLQAQNRPTEVDSISPYLLMNRRLQFEITDAVNHLYNFNFQAAEREFTYMKYRYPDHPLPEFLLGLSQWWRIVPNIEEKRYDKAFFDYMDRTIDKAKDLLDEDPTNREASFFLAGAYGFKGRLNAERKNWTAATFAGRNALKYLELSKGEEDLSPELLLGDALFNYFSVWIKENYTLLRPVLALFPDGDKALGLKQLREVANNAFYARIEAQYFLMRILSLENGPGHTAEALRITESLHNNFPNNPYFHRYYARTLYASGFTSAAAKESIEILNKIDSSYVGYEATSGRYAAFFAGQYHERMGEISEAKQYYKRAVSFGEEIEAEESGYYLYSLLGLGKIALKENNKREAKQYFNTIKKYAKRKHPAHEEARNFIKKNKL